MKNSEILVCNGEEHTLLEWCVIKRMSRGCLFARLERGMSVEEALNTPIKTTVQRKGRQKRQDFNCMNCIYNMPVQMDGLFYACDYMGKMGQRRPCEGGDKCTVKVKRGRNKK